MSIRTAGFLVSLYGSATLLTTATALMPPSLAQSRQATELCTNRPLSGPRRTVISNRGYNQYLRTAKEYWISCEQAAESYLANRPNPDQGFAEYISLTVKAWWAVYNNRTITLATFSGRRDPGTLATYPLSVPAEKNHGLAALSILPIGRTAAGWPVFRHISVVNRGSRYDVITGKSSPPDWVGVQMDVAFDRRGVTDSGRGSPRILSYRPITGNPVTQYFVALNGDQVSRLDVISNTPVPVAEGEDPFNGGMTQQELLQVLEAGSWVLPIAWEAQLGRWIGRRIISRFPRLYRRLSQFIQNENGSAPGSLPKRALSKPVVGKDIDPVLPERASALTPEQRQHILDRHAHYSIERATKFPKSWSDDKIISNTRKIINDPKSLWRMQTNNDDGIIRHSLRVSGEVDGVKIDVIVNPKTKGIITAIPKN
jgi:Bacterial EndoU nuclease